MGIDVQRAQAIAFGLGLAAVGIAGACCCRPSICIPGVGDQFTLKAFVMVVLGGMGHPGRRIAGLVLGVVESMTSLYWGNEWALVVDFVPVHPRALGQAERPLRRPAGMTRPHRIPTIIGPVVGFGLALLVPLVVHKDYELNVLFRICAVRRRSAWRGTWSAAMPVSCPWATRRSSASAPIACRCSTGSARRSSSRLGLASMRSPRSPGGGGDRPGSAFRLRGPYFALGDHRVRRGAAAVGQEPRQDHRRRRRHPGPCAVRQRSPAGGSTGPRWR